MEYMYWLFGALLCITNKRICGMIVNETTIHKRQNDTDINIYKSPYGTVSFLYAAYTSGKASDSTS